MGPVADCCPNCESAMLVLPHARGILNGVSWTSGSSDESGVFLRFRCGHHIDSNWVVCDCLIRVQRRSGVRMNLV